MYANLRIQISKDPDEYNHEVLQRLLEHVHELRGYEMADATVIQGPVAWGLPSAVRVAGPSPGP